VHSPEVRPPGRSTGFAVRNAKTAPQPRGWLGNRAVARFRNRRDPGKPAGPEILQHRQEQAQQPQERLLYRPLSPRAPSAATAARSSSSALFGSVWVGGAAVIVGFLC
jgi:hypothetical protein